MPENKTHRRLLSDIKPERYKIAIRPDFKDHTFSGEETIFLTLKNATKVIILHSVNLKIFGVLLKIGTKEFKSNKIIYDKNQETAAMSFKGLVPKGKGELFLKFEGKL